MSSVRGRRRYRGRRLRNNYSRCRVFIPKDENMCSNLNAIADGSIPDNSLISVKLDTAKPIASMPKQNPC